MTNEQIISQLRRLKVFGNLGSQEEANEYIRVLSKTDYTWLVRAIDNIIDTQERHSFPTPAEILKTSNNLKIAETDQKNNKSFSAPEESEKATGLFARIFRMVWMIEDENKRRYFWENRMNISERMTEQQQIEHYEVIEKEIDEYFLLNNLKIPVNKYSKETTLIPETEMAF